MSPRPWDSIAWLGVVAAVAACAQDLAAPGACPEFCPSTRIQVVDTVILGSVENESIFRGYVAAHRATAMQLVSEGTAPVSRAVVLFSQFPDSITTVGGAVREGIVRIDSFRVAVQVIRRDTTRTGLAVVVHRIPLALDSLTTLGDVAAFFADSTRIGTIPVPDTLTTGTVSIAVPPDAFPTFETDERRAAVGLALESPAPTFLDLGTDAGTGTALLTRFVQAVASAGDTVERNDARSPEFDTYLAEALPPPVAGAIVVGGVPSARAFLRVNLPSLIVDSSEVSRATLVLETEGPVVGAPDDAVRVRGDGLSSDFGPKSPLNVPRGAPPPVEIPVGTTGTIRIDVTLLVRAWRGNPTQPRVIVLRTDPEAARLAELRVRSSQSVSGRPVLQLTYVPLIAGTP